MEKEVEVQEIDGVEYFIVATKEDPTDPLEPTRYPSSLDFHTSF